MKKTSLGNGTCFPYEMEQLVRCKLPHFSLQASTDLKQEGCLNLEIATFYHDINCTCSINSNLRNEIKQRYSYSPLSKVSVGCLAILIQALFYCLPKG